jgi:hypothetical protein
VRACFLSYSDPDPVLFWHLDPGWVKNPGSGSGKNIPDHISESLETFFWAKLLKFFNADPGSGMEEIRIWDPG